MRSSRSGTRTLAAGLALAVLSVLLTVATTPARAATFPADMRIAYQQGCDIWLAHPSGAGAVNLTPDTPTTCETAPTISYTGRYVAYQRWGDTNWQTWLYDHTSRTSRRISVTEGAFQPVFSPTADVLAYHRLTEATRVADVYSVNLDGTARKNWTNDVRAEDGDARNGNYRPAWSPDGQSLFLTRTNAMPSCRVSFGGYDEIHHAQELVRVDASGTITAILSDPTWQVHDGVQAGGTTAYVAVRQSSADEYGYCEPDPSTDSRLFVDGVDVGPATSTAVVSATGDVFYSHAGQVRVKPAGAPVEALFAGSDPAIGPAWAGSAQDRADLSASISGLDRRTKTGAFDTVRATITNHGPGTARNVELRFGTPAGTFYTKVTKPGGGWACSMTRETLVRCNTASLAAGSSATLKVELLATDPQRKTKLAVRALSATTDPREANNRATSFQRIRTAPPPALKKGKGKPPGPIMARTAAPGSTARAADFKNRRWPRWYPVDGSGRFWFRATGLTCQRSGGVNDQGWLAATFWIWESRKSGTIRLELEGKMQPDTYGILKATRRKTHRSSNFPDDAQSRYTSLTVAWSRGGYDSYKMLGTWKFIRKHLHRNVKKKWHVLRGC